MLTWYRVEIQGRANGRPYDIHRTLQAESDVWAAVLAVSGEWPGHDVDHDYVRGPGGRRVVRFLLDSGDESRVYVTESETVEEMAREITDVAELARLNGDPVLPLAWSEDDAG